MSRLEAELRSTLASVRRFLDEGNVVDAGRALDDARSACALADGARIAFTDRIALLELVRDCTLAAQSAERALRQQLGAAASAQQAARAYGT